MTAPHRQEVPPGPSMWGTPHPAHRPIAPFQASQGQTLPPGFRHSEDGLLLRDFVAIPTSLFSQRSQQQEIALLRGQVVIASFTAGLHLRKLGRLASLPKARKEFLSLLGSHLSLFPWNFGR